MILVVNINPAVDKIYTIDDFNLDKIHRTYNIFTQAGGKGINVARACNILKSDALVTGIAGGITSQLIFLNLDQSKIKHDFYHIQQESRTCLIIIDDINKTQTVINEDGPILSNDDIDNFLDKYISLLDKTKILVISGSVPHSLQRDIYNELVILAKKKNIKAIVDASKNALKNVVEAKPYMIKPNVFEYCEVFADEYILNEALQSNFLPLIKSMKELINKEVENITVTLGELGAVFVSKTKQLYIKAPTVRVLNSIASGDAMTAAIASELYKDKSIEEALISGVAAGSANATIGGLRFTFDQYQQLREKITLINLESAGI